MNKSNKSLLLFVFFCFATTKIYANNDSIRFYISSNDLIKAKYFADKEITKNKNNAYTWFLRGEVYHLIYDKAEPNLLSPDSSLNIACTCYQKAVLIAKTKGKISSSYSMKLSRCNELLSMKGYQYYQEQEYEKSILFFESALDLFQLYNKIQKKIKFDTLTLFNYALALEKNGENEEAKQQYLKLLSLKFKNPLMYAHLAQLYKEQNQYQNAIKTLDAGLLLFPEHKLLLTDWLNLHVINESQDLALLYLKSRYAKNPKNVPLNLALAYLYDNIGNSESAEFYYIQCISLDSNFYAATFNLAVLYYNSAIDINIQLNNSDRTSTFFKTQLTNRNTLLKKALLYFQKSALAYKKETDTLIKSIEKQLR